MNGRVNSAYRTRFVPWLSWAMAMFLLVGAVAMMGPPAYAQDAENVDGYIYTVQDGDNWDTVAARTGVNVDVLQKANPDAVRDTGWILTGEKLTIPLPDDVESKTHKVSAGESWSTIADDYGVGMAALQAANQSSVRTGMILYNGEVLLIPPASPEEPDAEDPVTEEDADDATDEAATEDAVVEEEATVEEEPAAEEEPTAEELEVDSEDAIDEESQTDEDAVEVGDDDAAEESAESEAVTEDTDAEEADAATTEEAGTEEEPEEQPQEEVTEEATGSAAEETSEEVTATVPITETVIDADDPDAAETAETVGEEEAAAPPECPEMLADYPDTVVAVLDAGEGSAEALTDFLVACGADVEDGVVATDLTGDGVDDLVVVYQNPNQESAFVESDLIIVSPGEEGYEVAYRARAAGEVRLAAIEDVNEDGQSDVVWTDTTCGASTCFDTVNVRSWDGSVWADWTDGTITMAYADIELSDVLEETVGQEIQLTGGIYGSVGAGPQRSRTETWASVDGAPYTLAEKVYSTSECLYHTVLDANRALGEAEGPEGLGAAKALYEQAVTDESLIKCWVRPAELEELRSFSLFRLAVIDAYEGNLESAADRITELAATYPDGALVEAAQTWLDNVEVDGALSTACEAVTTFAEEHPEVWEILADYGYTNPSFEASDLCPPPEDAGEDTGEETALNGATGASPRSDPEAGAEAANTDTSTVSEEDARAEAIAAIAENLPDCPATLVDYVEALPLALSETDDDSEILERWMYACGGLAEDRGAVLTADLNGDDVDDFVIYPTVISDVGLGPDGAQGAVYIFHGEPDGGYELAASPEVYGKPVPLAIEDLNADGNLDVAWTVEGCSTFCVLETQIATWDGEEYTSLIEPGAAIASGEASLEELDAAAIGTGKELVLAGGVSGTPEGGLTVAHEEVWQSIEGAPFQRVSWLYDREVDGSNCLGLRLVEADVALQAADVLGYGPAFEQYAHALEPGQEACSIFGLRPDEELALLQGLANFRFIQVQALDEDLEGAQASLNYFAEQMADSPYVVAAQQWLEEFVASADAAAACDAIASILEDNPDLWQITDHFGYNHPALAAEQICYVPEE